MLENEWVARIIQPTPYLQGPIMATRNYTWVAITILAVAVCFLAISQTGGWFKRDPTASAQPEFGIAKRGSFSILLTKKGEVESAENVDIKCLTSGVILDIVPENTRAKEGDLLIKLSSIDQEIAIESQNVAISNAEFEVQNKRCKCYKI
jgi:multidrug efflux pump subunit AcrA (membrane-fusion protein)